MIGAHIKASSTRATAGHRADTHAFILAAQLKLTRPPIHASSQSSTHCGPGGSGRGVRRSAAVTDTAESATAAPPAAPPAESLTWMTCKRCKQQFAAEHNHRGACRYHSEGWTGGELAKATGFVRQSDAAEHQLAAVMGRTGLLRFWDCCGAEDEAAPGCRQSFHCAFDDEVNDKHGWR